MLVDLDVSKPESIRAAAEQVDKLLPAGLDNLVSNAGVSYNALKTFDDMYATAARIRPVSLFSYLDSDSCPILGNPVILRPR